MCLNEGCRWWAEGRGDEFSGAGCKMAVSVLRGERGTCVEARVIYTEEAVIPVQERKRSGGGGDAAAQQRACSHAAD